MRNMKLPAVFAAMILMAVGAKSSNVTDTEKSADTVKVVKPSCWKTTSAPTVRFSQYYYDNWAKDGVSRSSQRPSPPAQTQCHGQSKDRRQSHQPQTEPASFPKPIRNWETYIWRDIGQQLTAL